MSRGASYPRILSPSEAKKELSVPCLLILAGVAEPVFPIRDRGTPSPMVLISWVRNRPQPDLPSVVLPVPVEWRQWRTAVVPVLEDEMWRMSNPLTAALILTGGTPALIEQFGLALEASFVAAGWGPAT